MTHKRPLAPPRLNLLNELRLVTRDVVRFGRASQSLDVMPRGRGEPVLVIPALLTGDEHTYPLRDAIGKLGYSCYGWNAGVNTGVVDRDVTSVGERVQELSTRHECKVHIVGWSMGGVLARLAARRMPHLVASVVTMGSPVVGGAKYSAVAGYFRYVLGVDNDELALRAETERAFDVGVPVTALICKDDSWVSPDACVDDSPSRARNIEVDCSHLMMPYNAQVYGHIAEALHAGTSSVAL